MWCEPCDKCGLCVPELNHIGGYELCDRCYDDYQEDEYEIDRGDWMYHGREDGEI